MQQLLIGQQLLASCEGDEPCSTPFWSSTTVAQVASACNINLTSTYFACRKPNLPRHLPYTALLHWRTYHPLQCQIHQLCHKQECSSNHARESWYYPAILQAEDRSKDLVGCWPRYKLWQHKCNNTQMSVTESRCCYHMAKDLQVIVDQIGISDQARLWQPLCRCALQHSCPM